MRRARGSFVWFVLGVVFTGAAVWLTLPLLMLVTYRSTQGYAETLRSLEQGFAVKQDWKVLTVNDFQKSVGSAGFGDIQRVGSVSLCNPRYAAAILGEETSRQITALMPLNVGVYETGADEVYISTLNVGLMGFMFGETVADTLNRAGEDVDDVIALVARE